MVEMIAAFTRGDVARATELNARLIESFDFETGDLAPNPVPAKAMLRALGLPAGFCRPPVGPPPETWSPGARGPPSPVPDVIRRGSRCRPQSPAAVRRGRRLVTSPRDQRT